ncbi:hypothetical protein MLD52_01515 [Puniceicoccaceae bacterium K14]|nr:hypothetical protein [Puniceicoccaceae bacterium K14]
MKSQNKVLSHLILIAFASALALPVPFATAAQKEIQTESMTDYVLKRLVARENDAYERYEKATTQEDIERIKNDLQLVVDGYEKLISENPSHPAALVSYGMMLHRIGERTASAAMLIKADELDSGLAIVKNQLANYQAEDGNYNEALGFYFLARDLEPAEPLYPYQIGNLMVAYRRFFIDDQTYTSQDIDALIQDSFRNAALLDPANKQYRMRYAQSFFDINNPRWDLALDEWHKMQTLAEDDFEKQLIKLYTARVRYELEHKNAAEKLLDQIDHPGLAESKQELLEQFDY